MNSIFIATTAPAASVFLGSPGGASLFIQTAPKTAFTVSYNMGPQGPAGPGATLINSEIPTGTIDGANKVFTTSQTPNGLLLIISLNGLIQGSGDYTRSGATITFTTPPFTGDSIQVFYSY